MKQRARTQEDKTFRRIQILDAAEKYFQEVGYEAFSMASLARLAGVAKGTLYLYFTTREEVFLTLYNRSLVRWSHSFTEQFNDTMTDQKYVETLYATAFADGSFIPLLTRLEYVIEHNVAIDSLIQSKRNFIAQIDRIAELSSSILGLTKVQASEVIRILGVLLVGASSTDQGPSLDNEELPEDVQKLITSFSSQPLFIKNAVRIIEAIRTEAVPNI
jgi:TetR/AcrR family transcriptional regulator